jgi:hypothetical protein
MKGALWFALVFALAAAGVVAKPAVPDLVVHEWGTFLAMQGSDGVTLDGMYHEEHALPAFVHARSRDQLHLPSAILKGETPVIYFYTSTPQRVRVGVRFPAGVWTQWYPQASVLAPTFAQAASPLEPRDGRILWCADLIPGTAPAPLASPPPGALWNYARDVDAATVKTVDRTTGSERAELEKFLFYRGLGSAPLPLRVSAADGGTLTWNDARIPEGARHLFVLRVERGRGVYRYLPAVNGSGPGTGVLPSMAEALPLEEFSRRIGEELAARLVESGLYSKEARAMVNTWRSSYFKSDGARVLFVLPQRWTDRFIPLEMDPQPRELVRVMVGRVELLNPERERAVEAAVRDLGAGDAGARARAFAALRAQGRYAEPILRRVLRRSTDAGLTSRCRRLLATDFVTELRVAVNSATTGERITENPLYVRAQLASLLRSIGLDREAHQEAAEVYPALLNEPLPEIDNDQRRHPLRARARAAEALGDDVAAAHWYGEFIRFGSQVLANDGCRGACHGNFGNAGPTGPASFRDWWAGPRFAQALTRAGKLKEGIAKQEAALSARPGDRAAQLALAYLYAQGGESQKAAALWTRIGAPATAVAREAAR